MTLAHVDALRAAAAHAVLVLKANHGTFPKAAHSTMTYCTCPTAKVYRELLAAITAIRDADAVEQKDET